MSRWSMPVYGWDAVKLAQHYTTEQLVALSEEVRSHPDSKNTGQRDSFYLYTKECDRMTQACGWAIYYHQHYGVDDGLRKAESTGQTD